MASQAALTAGGIALVGGIVGLAYWQDYKTKKAAADAANAKAQEILGKAIRDGAVAQNQITLGNQILAQAEVGSAEEAKGKAILSKAQADYAASQEAQGKAIALKAQADYAASVAQKAAQVITVQAAQKGIALTQSQIDATAASMGIPMWAWVGGATLLMVGGIFWFTKKSGVSRRKLRRVV